MAEDLTSVGVKPDTKKRFHKNKNIYQGQYPQENITVDDFMSHLLDKFEKENQKHANNSR